MSGIRVDAATESRVRAAMAAHPRADFLPDEVRHLADADHPVMIGWNSTNSQPSTVARMLALLDVQPGDRVLDVGSGSGWTTAILSALAGEEGSVIGVELVPQLVEYGNERLAKRGTRAEIRGSIPGVLGLPDDAPFDRILVSAQAAMVPTQLVARETPAHHPSRSAHPATSTPWLSGDAIVHDSGAGSSAAMRPPAAIAACTRRSA